MVKMEQEPGSEDRDSAENGIPPLDMLDTPAKEATNVLRRLYADSTTSLIGDVAMDLGEGQTLTEASVIDPSETQYHMDLHGLSIPNSGKGITEKTRTQGRKSDLDQYQKHIYTPRSTRSMTQPAQVYNPDPELEEQPMTEAALSAEESDVPQIQAFAKLEFDDGEFYMNTYSVELGRDLQSARQAAEKVPVPAKRAGSRRRKRSASSGDASHIPRKLKREHNRSHPSSVVSERGGIIAVDHSDAESLGAYHSKKPASTSSSSQQMSRKSSMLFAPHHTDYQSLAMASLMGPDALRHYDSSNPPLPAPEACPLIPIHPPVKRLSSLDGFASVPDGLNAGLVAESVGTHQTISRKHVRIAFNFEKHLFEVHILGRNGAFVDEEYCCRGDVRPLTNGSSMQIGNVSVKFLLPEVAPGETGAERNANPNYASGMSGTSEEMSSVASEGDVHRNGHQASEDEEDSDTGKTSAQTSPEQRASSKTKSKGLRSKEDKSVRKASKVEATSAPKRKGPGRPPKNGIMSKREMGLLAKQAKEEAKAAKKGADGELAPGKAKTVKPNNEKPQETPSTQPNGKRKYTKRKIKVDAAQEPSETRESTEHTQSVAPEQIVPPKPLKEKKPPKPPRSPSPFIDRNSLSEEQLAKPTQSYVVLIHEALSESERGPMSLNQIYRAIAHKYPYFKFVVTTVGWQSSIRHNLLQHEAFEKIEREGKGWMWGLKPGVSIEKEKKRRPTPPPPQSHPYYPPPHMMQHQYGYYPGMPPPPPNGQAPYHPHYGPPPNGMPQYAAYPQGYYPPPPRPNGLALPLLNAVSENASTYQSPYDSAATTEPPQPNSQPPPPPQQPNASSHHLPEQPDVPRVTLNQQFDPTQPNQSRPPPFSASQTPINMTPESRQAVDRFKDVLMSSMPDKAFAELLITSAISRVFGSQQHSSLPGRGAGIADDPQEVMVMDALKNMIPSAVPKKDLPKPQKDITGDTKSQSEATQEQPPNSGGSTPGAIAAGLVDKEAATHGSSEAEVKEDDQEPSRETPLEVETPAAEHGNEISSREVMSSDPEKGIGTEAEKLKTSPAIDGTQTPKSTAEVDQEIIPVPSAMS